MYYVFMSGHVIAHFDVWVFLLMRGLRLPISAFIYFNWTSIDCFLSCNHTTSPFCFTLFGLKRRHTTDASLSCHIILQRDHHSSGMFTYLKGYIYIPTVSSDSWFYIIQKEFSVSSGINITPIYLIRKP